MSSAALSLARLRAAGALLLGLLLAQGCQLPEERYADELMARARADEPAVTRSLQKHAAAARGSLYKLGSRLKSRRSMLRKIRKVLHEDPNLTLAEVRIDDALRYTMQVDDQPAGNYATAVRRTLAAFEAEGHEVTLVKNYWPRGDSYSGINCVLKAPSGLSWELQFHTTQSNQVNTVNRAPYEELRRVNTAPERKQQLFDEMTRRWDAVPVPQGLLRKGDIHPKMKIIVRPRPRLAK